MSDLISILQTVEEHEPKAAAEMLPLVYAELRRLAAAKMAGQPPGQTLQATALVHEAFLKLVGHGEAKWQNRRHFFAAAAEAMRHILVDRARRKAAERHGGGQVPLSLDTVVCAATEATDESVLRVDAAIARLTELDRDLAELVKLRFFGGFTLNQTAELLDLSERTANRRWAYARAWLIKEIQQGS